MTRSEKQTQLENDKSFQNLFRLICAQQDQPCAIWLDNNEKKMYTFGHLEQKALAVAEKLQLLGISDHGGWVGLAVDTCPEWPILLWGLLAAGRQPVLIDPSLDDEPIMHLLRQSGATALITRRKRGIPLHIKQVTPETLLSSEQASEGFVPDWADNLALCTSGTTETSRVFVYNSNTISLQMINFLHHIAKFYITKEKRGPVTLLAFLPFNHILGFICMTFMLFIGYPQVFLKDRAPQTILETCRQAGVQAIVAVPLLINNLTSTIKKRLAKESAMKQASFAALSRLSLFLQRIYSPLGLSVGRKLFSSISQNLFGSQFELMVVGGSHTPRETLRTVHALGVMVCEGFGMTEVGITTVNLTTNYQSRMAGSVGSMQAVDYQIRPDGDDPNHGELLIRSEMVHVARLVDGRICPPALDKDGYFETGDIVRISDQRMYIEGRVKDVIIGESGENVFPDELEDVFSDLPGVEQLCVLATKKPDSPYDQTTLVLSVGANYSNETYLLDLARNVQQRNRQLPMIKRVHLVLASPETFPTVNSIKVKRIALREQLKSQKIAVRVLTAKGTLEEETPVKIEKLDEPAQPPDDLQLEEIREKVRLIFSEVLEADLSAIGLDAHFIDDLGGDSLQSLGVSLKIEEVFAINIPMEDYTRCTSVNDLSAVIYARMRGDGPFEAEVQRDERESITPITRFEDTPEFLAFQKRRESLEGAENPYFVCHDSPLLDTSIMNGQKVLNFGSYNYVGMSGRRETMEAAKAAIDQYGTSASGSRLLAGEKTLHQELEHEIAKWKHAEDALVLVGGHSTNVTFVGNFCGKDDLIVYDAISHNSVQEGCRLSGATSKPFPHNDIKALDNILHMQRDKYAKVLIIVEGAYSMDGDIAPIPELVALKQKYGCFLMVDEAHSACVIGKTGGGVDEFFDLKHNDIDIKMGTLSKGLGTCGGYLAGSRALIEYLRYNLPGFVFSVGISPPLAAATIAAIRTLREHPEIIENLRQNIRTFITEAHKRNLNTCLANETAIVPILVGRDEDAFLLSTILSARGVFVPPAVYPAVPKNKARLRFCVISEHKPEQIVKALDTLVEAAAELGIVLPSTT